VLYVVYFLCPLCRLNYQFLVCCSSGVWFIKFSSIKYIYIYIFSGSCVRISKIRCEFSFSFSFSFLTYIYIYISTLLRLMDSISTLLRLMDSDICQLGFFGLCNLLKSKEKREKKTIHIKFM
jgi:hypothetical protein